MIEQTRALHPQLSLTYLCELKDMLVRIGVVQFLVV